MEDLDNSGTCTCQHISAVSSKERGEWIPGFIDPAAKGRSQRDGTQLIELYRLAGLNVQPAVNAVEAGIYACERMMFSGRLKVFTSLSAWYQEFRMYRRDLEGRIVKQADHAMDAMRYLVMAVPHGLARVPAPERIAPEYVYWDPTRSDRWMA